MSVWARRTLLSILAVSLQSSAAFAWGDDGHEIVATIAQTILQTRHPSTWQKVQGLLSKDNDNLTAPDFVHRATWADKFRDSSPERRKLTHQWHFVDIEIKNPDFNAACFHHPTPANPASAGPEADCVVDKIEQFSAELSNTSTPQAERIVALKFLIHFVGDVHQPLHSSDNQDKGGNDTTVHFPDPEDPQKTKSSNLHHYWDTELVDRLGSDKNKVAATLLTKFKSKQEAWEDGDAAAWAKEAFSVSKATAYNLGTSLGNGHRLSSNYEQNALNAAQEQLFKAGVRLAMLLSQALP